MKRLMTMCCVLILGTQVSACSESAEVFVDNFGVIPEGGGEDDEVTEEERAEARRLASAKYRQANSPSNRSRFRTAPSKIGKF